MNRIYSYFCGVAAMAVAVFCTAKQSLADANDYAAMTTLVKPDVDTQGLVAAAVTALVAWWVPIVLIAILIAYVRYALKKGKSAPSGGGI